ncbi:MAG TPA: glycosyltransferase family 4 protein, partial [Bacillota bacterium]
MRILLVTQYFWPEEFRVNDLAAGLLEKGHEVTVLTGVPNYPVGSFFRGYGLRGPRRESFHGARVFRVPIVPRGKSKITLLANYMSFVLSASLLGPALCRGDFEIIVVNQLSPITMAIPAILLKRVKRAPLVLWVQDLWPESLSAAGGIRWQPLLKGIERLVSFIYKHCDLIMAQSEAFFPSILALYDDSRKLRYLPNWAESTYGLLRKTDTPNSLPEGFIVMFAGNVGVAQDFGTIIAAADKLRDRQDINWVIVGDGRDLNWVRHQVEDRGLNKTVHLLGRKPVEEMPRLLVGADALLVTLKRARGLSMTVP